MITVLTIVTLVQFSLGWYLCTREKINSYLSAPPHLSDVLIEKETETDTHTERQTDRQAGRHRQTESLRQRS